LAPDGENNFEQCVKVKVLPDEVKFGVHTPFFLRRSVVTFRGNALYYYFINYLTWKPKYSWSNHGNAFELRRFIFDSEEETEAFCVVTFF
jgi:hypothetical protein